MFGYTNWVEILATNTLIKVGCYKHYLSFFLVLIKSCYKLFGTLESFRTGRKLLLYSLNLPWVDNLFAFTEKYKHISIESKMLDCRISVALNKKKFRRDLYQKKLFVFACIRVLCPISSLV